MPQFQNYLDVGPSNSSISCAYLPHSITNSIKHNSQQKGTLIFTKLIIITGAYKKDCQIAQWILLASESTFKKFPWIRFPWLLFPRFQSGYMHPKITMQNSNREDTGREEGYFSSLVNFALTVLFKSSFEKQAFIGHCLSLETCL